MPKKNVNLYSKEYRDYKRWKSHNFAWVKEVEEINEIKEILSTTKSTIEEDCPLMMSITKNTTPIEYTTETMSSQVSFCPKLTQDLEPHLPDSHLMRSTA